MEEGFRTFPGTQHYWEFAAKTTCSACECAFTAEELIAGRNSRNSSMKQADNHEHGISAMRKLVEAMLCKYNCQNRGACRNQLKKVHV